MSLKKRAVIFSDNPSRFFPILKVLMANNFEAVALFTSKNRMSFVETKREPLFNNVSLVDEFNKLKLNDKIYHIKKYQPEIIIVVGFCRILEPELLEIPPLGVINLHAGKLPQYRGGSPLNWQIIRGEKNIGISILTMDSGIDTGAILKEGSFTLTDEETIYHAHNKANALFPELLQSVLVDLEAKKLKSKEQDESLACYYHQRNRSDGRLDFTRLESKEVFCYVRALTKPYPGAYCYLLDRELKIFSAKVPSFLIRGAPGKVLYLQGNGPFIICADSAIELVDWEWGDKVNARLPSGAEVTYVNFC